LYQNNPGPYVSFPKCPDVPFPKCPEDPQSVRMKPLHQDSGFIGQHLSGRY
jgi:hypothetical protein